MILYKWIICKRTFESLKKYTEHEQLNHYLIYFIYKNYLHVPDYNHFKLYQTLEQMKEALLKDRLRDQPLDSRILDNELNTKFEGMDTTILHAYEKNSGIILEDKTYLLKDLQELSKDKFITKEKILYIINKKRYD